MKQTKNKGSEVLARRSLKPEWFFLPLFLIVASYFALQAPMGIGLDEPAHIARTEQVANGIIVAPEVAISNLDRSLSGIVNESDRIYGGFQDYGLIHMAVTNASSFDSCKGFYSFPTWRSPNVTVNEQVGTKTVGFAFSNTAVNSPVTYLPQALLYRIALLFTHNAWWLIFAMRMGGIVALTLTLFFCIRSIPIGKWFMAVFCLLPSTLMDNVTVTADTMTLICCLSFITSFLLIWMDRGRVSNLVRTVLVISSLCMGLVKLAYLPLVLLLVLLPFLLHDVRVIRIWVAVGSILFASLLIFMLWYAQIRDVNTGALFNADVNPTLQKQFILQHPIFYLKNLLALSLTTDFFTIVSNFWTMPMNGNNSECSWLYLILIIISLGVRDSRERSLKSTDQGHWYVITAFVLDFIAIFVLVSTALYLQYTPYQAPYISGVQSRYFIPVFPLIILSLLIMARWACMPRINSNPSDNNQLLASRRNTVVKRILIIGIIIASIIHFMIFSKILFGGGVFIH